MKLRLSLTCAALALLALPAAAAAVVIPAEGPTASFALPGSHGYKLSISMSSGYGSLAATKEEGPTPVSVRAEYSTFATNPAGPRFAINLGQAGRISVRFRPIGRAAHYPDKYCKGGSTTVRHGVFEGTIRFDGEGGFTSAHAKRVKGRVSYTPTLNCHFPKAEVEHHAHQLPRPATTAFAAYSRSRSLIFEASADPTLPVDFFSVSVYENHGTMFITRDVETAANPSAFTFDSALNTATLTPPAPFTGSATFQRIDDHASRWEGSLAVELPGLGSVPLTGRDFSWALTQSSN